MWDDLGKLANVLQLLTSIPVFLAAVYYILYRRRIRRALDELDRKGGVKPAVLAVDCMGGDISVQVQEALRKQGIAIESSMVRTYKQPAVSPETAHTYLVELRELRDQLISEGVTELHLFIRGPVALAVGIGAIFDSTFPVRVYQFAQSPDPKESAYQYWVTIHQGSIAGMAPSRAERLIGIASRIQ